MTRIVHAVGTIIENKEGQILVFKRHINDPEGGKWGLVGGKIDLGENKSTAAIREIREEIGLEVKPTDLTFLETFHWNRPDMDLTFEVFKMTVFSDLKVKLARNELVESMWITPEELFKKKDLMIGLYEILKSLYQIK